MNLKVNAKLDPKFAPMSVVCRDMRDNGYFAHTSPGYGDVRQMLSHFGYNYSAAGENIAHHATADKAQAAFLSSPGHRKNILNTSFTHIGVGYVAEGKYWTQMFIRP